MQGLSLIHAGFLAAGLAVAVPIVIHLLFRQKTRTLAIGSVRFLHQVVREHRRRRRVRQWILLALRMLAVLLLALLFARPYWDASHGRGLDQEIVLLVDRSASMGAKNERGETSFERALAKLRGELSLLDANVVLHIGLCDESGVEEISVEQLKAAATTNAASDFGLALAWGRDVLAQSQRSSKRIVLISDLQRTGLRQTSLDQLPEGIELQLHDVGEALARNVAIESVTAVHTEIRPDAQVRVRLIVRNYGPLPVRQVPVRCDLDGPAGKITVSKQIDVAGHGSTVVELPFEIQQDGLYRGPVAVTVEDALSIDNQRWIAFEARHPDRVLLMDGAEGRSVFTNETYFLETALRLRTEESDGQMRSFEPERIAWESGEGFPRLDGYRAVVLANVRRLTAVDGERMDEYVRGGGSLLIFAGDQVTPDSVAVLQEHQLLPGQIAKTLVSGRLRVDQWNAKHPALACFADPQQGDLRRVEFTKLLPLESPKTDCHVLLQSGDFIVAAEQTVGRGRCLYFGSTADRDWTDLPRTPMYVPLVRQLLAYLTDQLAERSAVTSRLVTKAHDPIGITPVAGDDGRWLVTNLDPRESALDRVTPEEFRQLAGGKVEKLDEAAQEAALGITLPKDRLRPEEFWTAIVWLLLLTLVAELLLAGRVHA
jgi:hypothetical protein